MNQSGNVPILLLTGPPSSLSATNTTSSSCLAKKTITPALYLQPPTTPNVFGKQSTNSYTAKKSPSPLPTTSPGTSLAESFAFFHRQNIQKVSHQQPCYIISALIATWLLKECSSVLVSTITDIVNLSLTSGQFHPTLEESVISPLLMKPALDKEELSDYRPMSNLSLISKIIDRVVESRLTDHLTSNSLLNSHQSANIILPKPLFCTSTITSFRTGSQMVSRLCLLDLSGVFDNIDHDTLINRFSSWFGIHGSVLS